MFCVLGIERDKPSFIRPISDYCSVLNGATEKCFQSKNNSQDSFPLKTPLFKGLVCDDSEEFNYHDNFHKRPSTPPLGVNHIDSDESKPSKIKGGYSATHSVHERNVQNIDAKDDLMKNDHNSSLHDTKKQTSNHNITLDSDSNSPCSMLDENVGFVGQTSTTLTTTTTESRWLTATPQKSHAHKTVTPLLRKVDRIDNESSFDIEEKDNEEQLISQNDTSLVVADDPNVLIKHSSDPYSDFRLSMVTMIEEEGLQVFFGNN